MLQTMLGFLGVRRMERILYVCRVDMKMIKMMGKLCTFNSFFFFFFFDVRSLIFSVYTGTGDHHRLILLR